MANEAQLYKNITVSTSSVDEPITSKRYRGISTVGDRKNFNLYDINIIKQDIINHFHIRKGEKLHNPDFGTIIWDVLFDPLTTDLKEAIINNVTEIINYDPRVRVDSVTVDSYESGIQIEATLRYLTYSISETMRLKFDQTSGLI